MTTDTALNDTASGRRIFAIEPRASSTPTSRMAIDTASPETYSIRPCPKGCSLSEGAQAILKPTRVTTDEPASERLLKASATIAPWLRRGRG